MPTNPINPATATAAAVASDAAMADLRSSGDSLERKFVGVEERIIDLRMTGRGQDGVRWPVKLVLPVGFFLVGMQGISEIIKCIAALTVPGYKREHAYEAPMQ